VAKRFTRAFVETDPHLVVSVHPLMQHVPVRLALFYTLVFV